MFDPTETVLLFPDPEAKPLAQVDISKFRRAVFIDSTWQQSTKVRKHKALRGLPCVVIRDYESVFWRYQSDQPKTSLATIEAIYFFCREYQQQQHLRSAQEFPDYDGEFDNLLYYFMGQYQLIQKSYSLDRTKQFTSLHYDNYIKYEDTKNAEARSEQSPLTSAEDSRLSEKGLKRKLSSSDEGQNVICTKLDSG
jgi:hypothetical protein